MSTALRPDLALIAGHVAPGSRVLDIGCGKAFLLFELTQVVPGLVVAGLDTSAYALEHAPAEVRPFLHLGECDALAFEDASFDFVFSINLFHNLGMSRLAPSLAEMMRVGRDRRYICVESFRNAREKVNLLYWQLTCLSFHSPEDWLFIYDHFGYRGDYSFIYFE